MKQRFFVGRDMDSFGLVAPQLEDGTAVGADDPLTAGTVLLLDPSKQRSLFAAHITTGNLIKAPLIGTRDA